MMLSPRSGKAVKNMSALSARWTLIFPIVLASAAALLADANFPPPTSGETMSAETGEKSSVFFLPEPRRRGETSVEAAIASRRTRRDFTPPPLSLADLAQLLWAAQGITGSDGFLRTVPSAGALYPLDVYAVVGQAGAEGLGAGVYHYLPQRHALQRIAEGDLRQPLAAVSLHQTWMTHAPVSLVVTAEYERIEKKYGARGQRYALMEVGHACQNIFLQAEALGLAAGIVGAFDDNQVSSVLHLPLTHRPLIVMPVGHR
jgi:SagB-type dehydrogenase family enzyme